MYYLFMLAALLALAPEPDPNITIHGTVAPHMQLEGKWVYLWTSRGGDKDIPDSCRIENGRFCLRARIDDKTYSTDILMSKRLYDLSLMPGEEITIHIDTLLFPEVEGSSSVNEMYRFKKEYLDIGIRRMSPLLAEMNRIADPEDPRYIQLDDSLNYYAWEVRSHDLPLKYIAATQSPINFINFFQMVLSRSEISDEEIQHYKDEFNRRFPGNDMWEWHFETRYPSPSPRSEWAWNRSQDINGLKPMEFKPRPKPETVPDSIAALPAYAVGDTMYDFTLPGIDGNVTLSQAMETPYTLIDFWASWCMPCRKEVPQLLKIDRFFDSMTVVAVSLDKNPEEWKKAIQQDGSGRFIHLWIEPGNPEGQALKVRCSVTYIPTNFLIDRKRRIIARDLHGKQLVEMMNKLSEETGSKQ